MSESDDKPKLLRLLSSVDELVNEGQELHTYLLYAIKKDGKIVFTCNTRSAKDMLLGLQEVALSLKEGINNNKLND